METITEKKSQLLSITGYWELMSKRKATNVIPSRDEQQYLRETELLMAQNLTNLKSNQKTKKPKKPQVSYRNPPCYR